MIRSPVLAKGVKFPYNKHASILHYIRAQVRETPLNTALIDSEKSINYQDFFISVQYVAKQLKIFGLKTGDNVIILSSTCNELIILILAILMNGANYTAIDKSYPQQRISYLLNNSSTAFFIKEEGFILSEHADHFTTINLSDIKFYPENKNLILEMPIAAQGKDPAYIIYTSGSTGFPKGIIITHRAANNHMIWMKNQFELTSSDHFLLKTPLTFDPSVWEIFLPLYLGATLVIAKSGTHANPNLLIDYIEKYQISVLQLTPVVLNQLLSTTNSSSLKNLRYLFVGGESLPTTTKKLFFKKLTDCHLINLYGPAEATIDTTFHEVLNNEENFVHDYIGKPIYNVSLFVINENQQLCQHGEVGELYIEGDGLAQGYLNTELNDKHFILHPLKQNKTLVYKTGDLVKWSSDNILEYVGRKDHQLKINGVRIETNEIKQTILSYENIYDCVINFERNEENGHKLLICYLLPIEGNSIDTMTLKSNLAKVLPTYMIPHKYFVVDNICLSPNGKIDTKKLNRFIMDKNKNTEKTLAPKNTNDTKKTLLSIWSSVLNINAKELNEKNNFYDVGGDSISSFILLSKIKEIFSIEMTIEELIFYQTIDAQTQFIENKKNNPLQNNLASSTIFELNSDAALSVFLIHPIGGTVFWYLYLSKILDKKIRIYAVQDPGISTGNPLFNSIDEMANYYTKCILSIAPQKQYILGGASFGATVAVEIAKNLINHNCSVKSVLILDGWAVYPNHLANEKYFLDSMLRQQHDWKEKFNQLDFDISKSNEIFNVQMHRLKMLFDYKMMPFDFHVDIFKAKEIMPIFESVNEPYNHWRDFTTNLNLYNVPGNHETMFLKPNVGILAEMICKSLDDFK